MTLGTPIWLAMLAIVCAGMLLFAFQLVVHNVVKQAEARSRAVTEHTEAVWRCNHKVGLAQQESCHREFAASSPDNPTRQPVDGMLSASVSLASN
jgi:hypothetical protein